MRNHKAATAPVLRLVESGASRDTIEALAHLLSEAKAGRVVGIAYVAMHGAADYSADIAGEAKRSPTFTRGMLRRLDDEVGALE